MLAPICAHNLCSRAKGTGQLKVGSGMEGILLPLWCCRGWHDWLMEPKQHKLHIAKQHLSKTATLVNQVLT